MSGALLAQSTTAQRVMLFKVQPLYNEPPKALLYNICFPKRASQLQETLLIYQKGSTSYQYNFLHLYHTIILIPDCNFF